MRSLCYLDYYFKNLTSRERRGLIAKIDNDAQIGFYGEDYYLKIGNPDDEEFYQRPLQRRLLAQYTKNVLYFLNEINIELEKYEIAPLFPPVRSITTRKKMRTVLKKRFAWTAFRTDEECIKFFKCSSYNDYKPPVFKQNARKKETPVTDEDVEKIIAAILSSDSPPAETPAK